MGPEDGTLGGVVVENGTQLSSAQQQQRSLFSRARPHARLPLADALGWDPEPSPGLGPRLPCPVLAGDCTAQVLGLPSRVTC